MKLKKTNKINLQNFPFKAINIQSKHRRYLNLKHHKTKCVLQDAKSLSVRWLLATNKHFQRAFSQSELKKC